MFWDASQWDKAYTMHYSGGNNMFCDANNMFWDANKWDKAYHALLSFKRDPGQNPACGRHFFCLDIKKFWSTCEKDKYNDVNKHEKLYSQNKIQPAQGLNPRPHPYYPYTYPLHHCSFYNSKQYLIDIIYQALCIFCRENVMSSHDNLTCSAHKKSIGLSWTYIKLVFVC
jgi:hypothetical protein